MVHFDLSVPANCITMHSSLGTSARFSPAYFRSAYPPGKRGRQLQAGVEPGAIHQGVDDGIADLRLPDGLLEGIPGQEFHPGAMVWRGAAKFLIRGQPGITILPKEGLADWQIDQLPGLRSSGGAGAAPDSCLCRWARAMIRARMRRPACICARCAAVRCGDFRSEVCLLAVPDFRLLPPDRDGLFLLVSLRIPSR